MVNAAVCEACDTVSAVSEPVRRPTEDVSVGMGVTEGTGDSGQILRRRWDKEPQTNWVLAYMLLLPDKRAETKARNS